MERMGISLFPLRIRQQILSFSCLFQYALTGQFFQEPLQLPATVMQQQRGLLYLFDFVIRAFETEMIKKFVFQEQRAGSFFFLLEYRRPLPI